MSNSWRLEAGCQYHYQPEGAPDPRGASASTAEKLSPDGARLKAADVPAPDFAEARREAAEAMREACAQAVWAVVKQHEGIAKGAPREWRRGAELAYDAVRSVPLPGDPDPTTGPAA